MFSEFPKLNEFQPKGWAFHSQEDNSLEQKILGTKLLALRKEFSLELDQPENTEDPTLIFRDEMDEDGFPQILHFRIEEVKMFLRVVNFVTCEIIWEDLADKKLAPLEYLIGLQYLEWFEKLSLTSHLFNKETHLVYTFWDYLLSKDGMQENVPNPLLIIETREIINKEKSSFGHLTLLHYHAELTRDTFLEYITSHLIERRRIQKKSNPRPSHFKRSSDHSASSSRSISRGEQPSLRTRNFRTEELSELSELTIQERKIHPLLVGSSLSPENPESHQQ